MHGFIDEYGTSQLDTTKDDVSTCFIIAAVIVKDDDMVGVSKGIEAIRKNYFQKGEIKSSKISKKHKRRLAILSAVSELPFSIYSLVIDKEQITSEGLGFKKSFIKFFHKVLFDDLYASFPEITMIADEHGSQEFMEGFKKYVKKRIERDLFGQSVFAFGQSKEVGLLQLADLIAGTLGYIHDKKKTFPYKKEVYEILGDKISGIKEWPIQSDRYEYILPEGAGIYDMRIFSLSKKTAQQYIQEHRLKKEQVVRDRIRCLYYLLHHFIYIDSDKYVPTQVLIDAVIGIDARKMGVQYFRSQLIAKLRDAGVIIVSSSKGYKLPASQAELYEFINYSSRVVQPMMFRISMCRDRIKLLTGNEVDILDKDEYEGMRKYLDK